MKLWEKENIDLKFELISSPSSPEDSMMEQHGEEEEEANKVKSLLSEYKKFSPLNRRQRLDSFSSLEDASSSPSSTSTFSSWRGVKTPHLDPTTTMIKDGDILDAFNHKMYYFNLITATRSIPQAGKKNLGEDAFFSINNSVGVADGVGGWSAIGVDAGLYSRKLMQNVSQHLLEYPKDSPRKALGQAYLGMGKTVGTTTACVATLQGTSLEVANLGDSGYILLRHFLSAEGEDSWRIVSKSIEQEHYFNCPYQIGTDATDFPRDADIYTIPVHRNDILIVATDGVFDNLFHSQILDIVTKKFPDQVSFRHQEAQLKSLLIKLASDIAEEACKISTMENVITPFNIVGQQHGLCINGGKSDDISVIVAMVEQQQHVVMEEENTLLEEKNNSFEFSCSESISVCSSTIESPY